MHLPGRAQRDRALKPENRSRVRRELCSLLGVRKV